MILLIYNCKVDQSRRQKAEDEEDEKQESDGREDKEQASEEEDEEYESEKDKDKKKKSTIFFEHLDEDDYKGLSDVFNQCNHENRKKFFKHALVREVLSKVYHENMIIQEHVFRKTKPNIQCLKTFCLITHDQENKYKCPNWVPLFWENLFPPNLQSWELN